MDAPPPLLYAKGKLELANIPIVAIVSARNGSAVGQKFTRQIATELALEGFVIASGLARGIDTASHMAALEHGTVAVLAGGIDIVYPPENAELQHAIGERGLLISEPSRLLATRQGFPAAQPADLGDLARRGGDRGRRALRLADHRPLRRRTGTRGLRRSRQPADPRSAGTNNLLKQGACLITSARDILETLAPILGRPPAPPPPTSIGRPSRCPTFAKANASWSRQRLAQARSISTS